MFSPRIYKSDKNRKIGQTQITLKTLRFDTTPYTSGFLSPQALKCRKIPFFPDIFTQTLSLTTAFTIGGIVFKITKIAQGFLPANNIEQIK